MTVQITVNIPENIYKRAKQLANLRQQDVSVAIVSFLDETLPENRSRLDAVSTNLDAQIAQEISAYKHLHAQLWKQFPNHHVAIYKGQLVDHDIDGVALSMRIDSKYPNDFVLMRQVEAEPERVLYFRSPRIQREE